MERILECVPNFSEGRNEKTIGLISNALNSISGATVLHTDVGYSANRTVFTLAGKPEHVIAAAYEGIKVAVAHIDMSQHSGNHPRIGSCDVCPLIPIKNISMAYTRALSLYLASKVGRRLKVPVYMYETSAMTSKRQHLEYIRKGNYEGFTTRMKDSLMVPDFGPLIFNATSGATVVGARPFLIAFNINLDTTDITIAKQIARAIRTSGYRGRAGKLKNIKAIGWYMEEYGCAQVSLNLTDYHVTGLAEVWSACQSIANQLDTNLMGSELIGMVPQEALSDAAHKMTGGSIADLISTLGLDQLAPFKPEERIIELKMASLKSKA